MTTEQNLYLVIADLVLALHLAIVAFVVLGLPVIWIGDEEVRADLSADVGNLGGSGRIGTDDHGAAIHENDRGKRSRAVGHAGIEFQPLARDVPYSRSVCSAATADPQTEMTNKTKSEVFIVSACRPTTKAPQA